MGTSITDRCRLGEVQVLREDMVTACELDAAREGCLPRRASTLTKARVM